MSKLITAQEYRDGATVAEKLRDRDFTVYLSPAFEIGGEEYQVVVDGHHSYEAAKQAGVEPEYIIQTSRDNDTIAMIEDGRIEDFLETHRIDSDYRFLETGEFVW